MPNYVAGAAKLINPGQLATLFNLESPTAPQASVGMARRTTRNGEYAPVNFVISFSEAPTNSLQIQGAHQDADSAYQTVYTSTNRQQDFYADQGMFPFYRAKIVSWVGGGTLTVVASLG